MPAANRDRIFISYSRQDQDIYLEVRQKLLDRGLGDSVWDDTDIRSGEQWDPRIQGMMDRTAVAVLILSDRFFRRRREGGEYILDKELPYFLEHYTKRELDLLPLYWNPSPYFAPDGPDPVKPFEYDWLGQPRSYDLHRIQALARNGRLAGANEQDKLDALQKLALEAEGMLNKRLTGQGPSAEPDIQAGRHALTVDISIAGAKIHRIFKLGGQVIPVSLPGVPQALLEALKASAGIASAEARAGLGSDLYQLLFGPANQNGFPRLAQAAWDLAPGSQANTLAVAAEVRCDAMADDPWPLGLPWNLTAFQGESLAEHCGWGFEVRPPGEGTRHAQILSPEPPLLFLFDDRAEGARRHAGQLNQYLDRAYGFAADAMACRAIDQLAQRVTRAPEPEILYAYATAGLDLERLAGALGNAVPLVVLNLVGERPPMPPAGLVRNRKVVVCLHPAAQADAAREKGHRWLRTFLEEAGRTSYQRAAILAFGPGVRLWSGCAGLETRIAQARGGLFRRPLIKLLLDRVSARREVSDEVATALREDRGVLGLVAAGTPDDHPALLPPQVWHHYAHVREAASRDAIRRLELSAGPIPDAGELLYQLAAHLGAGTDAWEDALDRQVGETQPGERVVLSLEWQVPQRPAGTPPEDWRKDWLDAWLTLGTETLAGYRKQGVLIVHTLLVEVPEAAEADGWCRGARDLYRDRRRRLSESGRRFVHHFLAPLSLVPVEDIERFLDLHYRLRDYYPELDPYAVAGWVHEETKGIFAATVRAMEDLHDTGFQAAYATLEDGAR